jgi:hypothetical protein
MRNQCQWITKLWVPVTPFYLIFLRIINSSFNERQFWWSKIAFIDSFLSHTSNHTVLSRKRIMKIFIKIIASIRFWCVLINTITGVGQRQQNLLLITNEEFIVMSGCIKKLFSLTTGISLKSWIIKCPKTGSFKVVYSS